jgi:hypothetical protein
MKTFKNFRNVSAPNAAVVIDDLAVGFDQFATLLAFAARNPLSEDDRAKLLQGAGYAKENAARAREAADIFRSRRSFPS